jgi:hypothetical protein
VSQVRQFQIQDENGSLRTINIVTDENLDIITTHDRDDKHSDREEYGIDPQAVIVQMSEVHQAIEIYSRYAIDAFKNFADDRIEEVTVKFGLKIGGKTGIPFLAEASSEGNFEIEVKCKFPTNPN